MHGTMMKKLICAGAIALAALAPLAQAEEKKTFNLAWTIYVGWMPWKYADESGIMKKWADKYGIEVNISQINDYV
ncbi:MAG TPA: lipid kinase, partial [Pseudomonas sp.]|nr:lipid kinase [Pseudomonas sp.]